MDEIILWKPDQELLYIMECLDDPCFFLHNVLLIWPVLYRGENNHPEYMRFMYCLNRSHDIHGYVEKLEGDSSLESIVIPENIINIEKNAFRDCTNLDRIILPKGISSIGGSAFYGCNHLKDVYYVGTENDRKQLFIAAKNDPIKLATWHYCSIGPEDSFSVGDYKYQLTHLDNEIDAIVLGIENNNNQRIIIPDDVKVNSESVHGNPKDGYNKMSQEETGYL